MRFTIGHPCFLVKDLSMAMDFYGSKLGLRHMFDQEFPNGMKAVYFRFAPGQFLELIGNVPHEDKANCSFSHLCLHVEDTHSVQRELKEKGVKVTDVEPGASPCFKCYAEDPDGNMLEIMQLTPASLQTIHDHD